MNPDEPNDHESRVLRLLQRFDTRMHVEGGASQSADLRREMRLTILSAWLDRCTDQQLRAVRAKLADDPISGNLERGALDLIDGKISIRDMRK